MENLRKLADQIAAHDEYSRYSDWFDEKYEIDRVYEEFGWDGEDGYFDYDFDEEEFPARDDGSSPLAYL